MLTAGGVAGGVLALSGRHPFSAELVAVLAVVCLAVATLVYLVAPSGSPKQRRNVQA